jgi:hypothetical protein
MRVNLLVTHLNADEAHTLIAFLDQLREVLMNTYGNDIAPLWEDSSRDDFDDDPPDE